MEAATMLIAGQKAGTLQAAEGADPGRHDRRQESEYQKGRAVHRLVDDNHLEQCACLGFTREFLNETLIIEDDHLPYLNAQGACCRI